MEDLLMDATRAKVIGERMAQDAVAGRDPNPAEAIELFVGLVVNIARIADDVAALKKDRLGS